MQCDTIAIEVLHRRGVFAVTTSEHIDTEPEEEVEVPKKPPPLRASASFDGNLDGSVNRENKEGD